MNKKKGFNKNKTNFNSFLKDYEQNQNKKKDKHQKKMSLLLQL